MTQKMSQIKGSKYGLKYAYFAPLVCFFYVPNYSRFESTKKAGFVAEK
jgi:hypothetical protein